MFFYIRGRQPLVRELIFLWHTKWFYYYQISYLLQRFERVFCFAKHYITVVSLLYTLFITWFLDPKFVLFEVACFVIMVLVW